MQRFPIISRITGSLLVLCITLQCSHKEIVLAPKIAGLVGTWQLIEPDSTYSVTLKFALDTENPPLDITPFKASGKASINDYTLRSFATIDGTMSGDNLTSTKTDGSPEAMTFEQVYFANLQASARYELPTENRLRLYHGGPQPGVFVFKKLN